MKLFVPSLTLSISFGVVAISAQGNIDVEDDSADIGTVLSSVQPETVVFETNIDDADDFLTPEVEDDSELIDDVSSGINEDTTADSIEGTMSSDETAVVETDDDSDISEDITTESFDVSEESEDSDEDDKPSDGVGSSEESIVSDNSEKSTNINDTPEEPGGTSGKLSENSSEESGKSKVSDSDISGAPVLKPFMSVFVLTFASVFSNMF